MFSDGPRQMPQGWEPSASGWRIEAQLAEGTFLKGRRPFIHADPVHPRRIAPDSVPGLWRRIPEDAELKQS